MLSGKLHLSLLIGAAVPIPAPRAIVEALSSVEVKESTSGASGFQLTFNFGKRRELSDLMLLIGGIGPLVRCILISTVNGTPYVLMDGVITHQQVSPQTGQSTLTLTGEDLSALMNQIDLTGIPYPGMPPSARVALILAKYAILGVIPVVIPSIMIDVPIPTDRTPTHQGTDLQYIRQLAREVGYVFYVDPGPEPGMSLAYWGPEVKIGPAQPALNVDMDAHTNVESLSFQFDAQSRTLPVVFIQNQQTRAPIPIPIPDITPLNPPLGAIAPPPTKFRLLRNTANLSPIRAVLRGVAEAARSADLVTASGSLDVLRYGHVLRPRGLVGVRGAGVAFDGLYYVQSVTHSIKRGEYKQNFTLTRNALVSLTPQVPV
ncbi:MAG: hypothetical protein PVI59_03320 [Anaerolineae bacterium]|jgi:hypothetical protein